MSEQTDTPPRRRWSSAVRATAATLAAALTFAAVAPPLVSAKEVESEGEGSSPPGTALPGLEEGFEPGGEETGLGEVVIGPGEEEAEEAPVEAEVDAPPIAGPEAVVPPAGSEAEPGTTGSVPPPVEKPSTEATTPLYEAEEGPTYEAAPRTPPAEAVRGEAIVAPRGPEGSAARAGSSPERTKAPAPVVGAAPEPGPAEPPEEPPAAARPVVTATVADGPPGSLSGREEHTVAAGECLWSIAEAVLPPHASDARLAAEVQRLWHLNAARIGTGDPSLIMVGTVLRLR